MEEGRGNISKIILLAELPKSERQENSNKSSKQGASKRTESTEIGSHATYRESKLLRLKVPARSFLKTLSQSVKRETNGVAWGRRRGTCTNYLLPNRERRGEHSVANTDLKNERRSRVEKGTSPPIFNVGGSKGRVRRTHLGCCHRRLGNIGKGES